MNDRALELFRKACGLSAPLALECEAPSRSAAASATRSFDHPFVLVGRDRRSDLFLEHSQVSRHHAFLQTIAGRVFVTDLQSRTKVYWEGEESPRAEGWFDHDRFIQVGPYRIRRIGCDAGEHEDDVMPARSAPRDHPLIEASPMPRAALELPFRVGGVPSLWPLEGQLAIVGRSDLCQLVLTDESVSRFHAALVPTPSGLWVVDLLAREGVHVNGASVRWAWLADGDTLRLGRVTFILRYETPPDQLTRRDVPLEAGASFAEHPGTELAVLTGHRDNARNALAVRADGRSPLGLKPASSPPTIEPATLMPAVREEWQQSVPYPPNQMAMWQQQMQLMESFHNDMILMVQMFVAMHKEHSASVRHELDMVQRLTRELSALQAKTGQSPGSENEGVTAGIDRPSEENTPAQAKDRKKQQKKPGSEQRRRDGTRTKPNPTEPAGR
jgi:pSer/pThr/pTyr-binding forkhead associated (FHA) protein